MISTGILISAALALASASPLDRRAVNTQTCYCPGQKITGGGTTLIGYLSTAGLTRNGVAPDGNYFPFTMSWNPSGKTISASVISYDLKSSTPNFNSNSYFAQVGGRYVVFSGNSTKDVNFMSPYYDGRVFNFSRTCPTSDPCACQGCVATIPPKPLPTPAVAPPTPTPIPEKYPVKYLKCGCTAANLGFINVTYTIEWINKNRQSLHLPFDWISLYWPGTPRTYNPMVMPNGTFSPPFYYYYPPPSDYPINLTVATAPSPNQWGGYPGAIWFWHTSMTSTPKEFYGIGTVFLTSFNRPRNLIVDPCGFYGCKTLGPA